MESSSATTQQVLDLQRTVGNEVVTRVILRRPAPAAKPATDYPWRGEVSAAYSVALRREPRKDPAHPHDGTLADLPRGKHLSVVGEEHGWLHVEVDIGGSTMTGYVSHELIRRVPVIDLGTITVTAPPRTEAQAFVALKRAETRLAKQGDKYKPSEDEKSNLDFAIELLEDTHKYTVDRATYRVSFVQPTGGGKIKINTIEEFILFVETVERTYSAADAGQVASEIREIWNADANWQILVASQGITNVGGEKFVDIETPPNPIAMMFDMKDLGPSAESKNISTPMGSVTINHVMAGIDAALSGFPSSYPEAFLDAKGNDSRKLKAGYAVMKEQSQGNVRDFTTWAGDLGQAYAEYIVDRWLKDNDAAKLAPFVADKAPDEQLLGDIHGFIALTVQDAMPADASPTGGHPAGAPRKVSDILRDMYLVEKNRPGTGRSYEADFRSAAGLTGKSDAELVKTITERSLAFARPWYSKKAYDYKGFWKSKGWGAKALIENGMERFDVHHQENEDQAAAEDKIGGLVQKFIGMLKKATP